MRERAASCRGEIPFRRSIELTARMTLLAAERERVMSKVLLGRRGKRERGAPREWRGQRRSRPVFSSCWARMLAYLSLSLSGLLSSCVSSKLFQEATQDLRTCRSQLDEEREQRFQSERERRETPRPASNETPPMLVTEVEREGVAQLLGQLGAQVLQVRGEQILFEVNRLKGIIQFFEGGKFLLFRANFTGFRTTLQFTNDWNLRRHFSYAYLSQEGNALIESDLLLSAGVSAQTVHVWLRICLEELVRFHQALVQFEGSL